MEIIYIIIGLVVGALGGQCTGRIYKERENSSGKRKVFRIKDRT